MKYVFKMYVKIKNKTKNYKKSDRLIGLFTLLILDGLDQTTEGLLYFLHPITFNLHPIILQKF